MNFEQKCTDTLAELVDILHKVARDLKTYRRKQNAMVINNI